MEMIANTTVLQSVNIKSDGVLSDAQFLTFVQFYAVVLSTASAVGAVSNVINIKTFIALGLEDGVTVSFLGLSLSDLSYLLLMVVRGVSAGLDAMEDKSNYSVWCLVDPFTIFVYAGNAAMLVYLITIFITTFLAVARCMCVVRPFQFRNTFTRRKSLYFLSGIAVFAVVTYVPLFHYMGISEQFDGKINTTRPSLWISPAREEVKDIIWGFREAFLPAATQLIVLVCVVVMVRGLKDSFKFRRTSARTTSLTNASTAFDDTTFIIKSRIQHGEEHNSSNISRSTSTDEKSRPTGTNNSSSTLGSKDRQVITQVILISVVYIVCNIPKIMMNTVCILVPDFGLGGRYENLYVFVIDLMEICQTFNSSINIVIYYQFNPKFRSHCRI